MAANTPTEWTLMIYLAGDNDLEKRGFETLDEIRTMGSTNIATVLAQLDTRGERTVERLKLRKSGMDEDRTPIREPNTGSKEALVNFVEWCRGFPSNRKMLVIWNHGAGLDPEDIAPLLPSESARGSVGRERLHIATLFRHMVFPKAVSAIGHLDKIGDDHSSGDYLDNDELGQALRLATQQSRRALDILGFEACLMNTIEVVYQVRNYARILIGSQSVIPEEGWPYDKIMHEFQNPNRPSDEVAWNIVGLAAAASPEFITISALELAHVRDAADAVSRLADVLRELINDPTMLELVDRANFSTQAFVGSDTIDLIGFCENVARFIPSAPIVDACRNVIERVRRLVLRSETKGGSLASATGVSIFLPKRRFVAQKYRELDFAKETSWLPFVERFLGLLYPDLPSQPTRPETAEHHH